MRAVKLACCWLAAAAAAALTEPGVELAAVMTPPVILNVVVPGLDKWPAAAAVTVLTDPSESFTCAPWEPPTTCQSKKSQSWIKNLKLGATTHLRSTTTISMNIFKLAKKQVGRQKINYHTKSISNLKLIFFPDFDKLKQSQSFFLQQILKECEECKVKRIKQHESTVHPPSTAAHRSVRFKPADAWSPSLLQSATNLPIEVSMMKTGYTQLNHVSKLHSNRCQRPWTWEWTPVKKGHNKERLYHLKLTWWQCCFLKIII